LQVLSACSRSQQRLQSEYLREEAALMEALSPTAEAAPASANDGDALLLLSSIGRAADSMTATKQALLKQLRAARVAASQNTDDMDIAAEDVVTAGLPSATPEYRLALPPACIAPSDMPELCMMARLCCTSPALPESPTVTLICVVCAAEAAQQTAVGSELTAADMTAADDFVNELAHSEPPACRLSVLAHLLQSSDTPKTVKVFLIMRGT
jgi:hypothetical protein